MPTSGRRHFRGKDRRSDAIEKRLRRLRGQLDALAQHLEVVVFALMLPGEVRIARDLLQHGIELGRGGGDPLQVFVIEHILTTVRLVAISRARPPDASEDGGEGKCKGTDGEHVGMSS